MAFPIYAYVASILTGSSVGQSASLTATVVNTGNFEIQVPIRFRATPVSADPIITIYRATDGGTNFDTTGVTSFSVARSSGTVVQASVALTTGIYALQLLNSGPTVGTFQILTQAVVTAVS